MYAKKRKYELSSFSFRFENDEKDAAADWQKILIKLAKEQINI